MPRHRESDRRRSGGCYFGAVAANEFEPIIRAAGANGLALFCALRLISDEQGATGPCTARRLGALCGLGKRALGAALDALELAGFLARAEGVGRAPSFRLHRSGAAAIAGEGAERADMGAKRADEGAKRSDKGAKRTDKGAERADIGAFELRASPYIESDSKSETIVAAPLSSAGAAESERAVEEIELPCLNGKSVYRQALDEGLFRPRAVDALDRDKEAARRAEFRAERERQAGAA